MRDAPKSAGSAKSAFPVTRRNVATVAVADVGAATEDVTLSTTAPTAGFTITATATGAPAADTACQTFTVDNTGLQKAYDASNNDNTTTCWQ